VSVKSDFSKELLCHLHHESVKRYGPEQQSEWIGMDYGDVIVHIFLPELRNYYNIDLLWGDAHSERIPNLD
jgi:ribosome-associated protein